ncbi:peptide ABC transporter substrate-binding protein [Alkaliphilus peptidifermentans]|uniref:Oligopeptide transport system substrate-binding protein n=1 Tax=Alkaliphilus peptidifermentans DSM 18978 TaxID=1120976 RepID=A0A1G5AYH1_9FIRM|nr:peptide ABC transporter substrate-binding protein [Alkaliphilus peptidifermentans]SCX82947.1 oligopeptide transport system substrate-binding protein [Alkaliphilus peptidifermentans DSM 18978]
MKGKMFLAILLSLLLAVVGLVGCSSEDVSNNVADEGLQESSGIDREQYLNLVLEAEPTTLDPSKGSDMYSNRVLNNVLEPLTRLEEDENQSNYLAAAGAESWEHNEDGTVWTFKIRPNKWSDGVPVRAQDYEYGIKRSVAQETASPYAYLLEPIKNASKVNSGELSIDELGVRSLDDETLEITLEAPTPYFLALTYQRVMMPQREDVVALHGDSYGTQIDKIVYNGPFVLGTWVHNSELILNKNHNYWDAETVSLDNVNLKIIQDENAVYNSLSNGSIDIAIANNPDWRQRFINNDKLNHFEVVRPSTFFMFFNTRDDVFQNVNIRKAFSIGLDREEMANVIFHGVNTPAYGWVAPSITIGDDEYRSLVPGPVKRIAEENDPKELLIKGLQELGRSTDPADLTIKVTLGSTDQWFRNYGEYIQQMYNRNLGVNVEIEQVEWPVFSQMASRGEVQIGYMGWGAEFNDPASLMSLMTSTSTAIETGWSDERYDELIALAASEMDPAKRLEYFREAEEILLYEASVLVPTVHPRINIFRYKYVNDIGVTPLGTSGYKYGYTQGR